MYTTTPGLHFSFFLNRNKSYYVFQAGLELLVSSNPASLASQIVEITGVSHNSCLSLHFLEFYINGNMQNVFFGVCVENYLYFLTSFRAIFFYFTIPAIPIPKALDADWFSTSPLLT